MLTEKAIINAEPKEKIYRIADKTGSGLCLEVAPSGGKRWRLRYRFAGKPKMISLGVYPLVSLKEARERAFSAKKDIEKGIDPSKKKHAAVIQNDFRSVALEWWVKFQETRGGRYPAEVWRRLIREVFPFIGKMPIDEITAPDILKILRRVEERGTIETAHKIKSHISQTMRYAIACGHIYVNPARDLAGALSPKRKQPMAAIIDPIEAGQLMRSIYGYEGSWVVRCALELAALTFVRPGELRKAEWAEIDIESAEWRISAEKMKMRRAHIVPLSRQSTDVLKQLHNYSGHGRYVFPSIRTMDRPMSDMTINAAIRAMGYPKDKMTGHGFRAMASSLLAEQGWSIDAIERQLAHVERSQVRAAYHRSEHLEERTRMMQAWADYLDFLRASK